jgi:putative FmdB family regulatory protein
VLTAELACLEDQPPMPTYQYRCAKCGEQFEAWQSIHDPALTTHEDCGGQLAKVLGVGGIVLKGSGFYRTDNRAKRSEGREKESSKESSSSNGSSDKKDTKSSDSSSKSPSKSDTSKS